jgi:hypothetical protein
MARACSCTAAGFPPAEPGPIQWQGDLGAFTSGDPTDPRSFLVRWPEARVEPLEGRFSGWLDQSGRYLAIADSRLLAFDVLHARRVPPIARDGERI